jgi:hypothetical protein
MKSAIWDRKTGKQIGWVDGHDVYSSQTQEIFAPVRKDGNLYDLNGNFLNVHLENSESGNPDLTGLDTAALANFKKLAGF